MMKNIDRLRRHARELGVQLRPHLKTAKCVEVARRQLTDGNGPATVSTLREAEAFFAAGVRDILYAVGIGPDKLDRVIALRRQGCDLTVILDSVVQARAVVEASRVSGEPIPAMIEIDSDQHRSGLAPDSPNLAEIGAILHAGGALLRGVVTHAGESYGARGAEALAAFAEQERLAAVTAAETLRKAGLPCPIVSVGSTPTAHFARDLTGVTELRAGVYVFFDLVMAGIEVCAVEDIALSVLATVIGHQQDRGWILIDAGWMALSRDRGTANQTVDQGYGVVCDLEGRPYPDLVVKTANQEHGIVAVREGSGGTLPALPIGAKLRILPNHACATGAQFDGYEVLPADITAPLVHWDRFRGW
jgi:D-serine deaminase-like pyridoxal phosphate-dependent protein